MQEDTHPHQHQSPAVPCESGQEPLGQAYAPMSVAHSANPYIMYARMRRAEPVFFSPRTSAWVVSRYDDVLTILKDPKRFSISVLQIGKNRYTPAVAELMRSRPFATVPKLLDIDPPIHTRLRNSVTKAMSASRMAGLEPRIRQFADRLIDQFAPDTHLDFMQRFARPFPILVIASLMNVPEEDLPRLHQWHNDATDLITTQPEASQQLLLAQSYVAMEQYIYDLVEQRRKAPQDDLASDLLTAVDAGQAPLSVLEAANLLFLLFGAGFETSVKFLGNGLLVLLSDRAYWQAIREKQERIPALIEELLRFNPPSLATYRRANQEVELGGQTIPKGAMIEVLLASADHDEAVFPAAETFDPQRERTNRHLAFGYGIHFCLGAPLARLETRVALEQLSQRLPSLRLVPDQEISYTPDLLFHGVKQLLVEWDEEEKRAFPE